MRKKTKESFMIPIWRRFGVFRGLMNWQAADAYPRGLPLMPFLAYPTEAEGALARQMSYAHHPGRDASGVAGG
jgi:hypothetical protein